MGDIRSSDDVCYASDNIRSSDNLFHASYNSSDLRFASCAYHLIDVDASANIHGTSSAHDIPCANCPHDFNDVGASDNLSSTCCSNDIPISTNDLPRIRHGLRNDYNVLMFAPHGLVEPRHALYPLKYRLEKMMHWLETSGRALGNSSCELLAPRIFTSAPCRFRLAH